MIKCPKSIVEDGTYALISLSIDSDFHSKKFLSTHFCVKYVFYSYEHDQNIIGICILHISN